LTLELMSKIGKWRCATGAHDVRHLRQPHRDDRRTTRQLQRTFASSTETGHQATGPCPPGEEPQGQARVRVLAVDLFVPGDVIARDLERLAAATKFPAALLGVTIEDTSTRGILRLRNVSGDLEVIRPDRGAADAGAAMIARAPALVGRRVLVYKDMEGLASNPLHKVRDAVHVMAGAVAVAGPVTHQ
jgi:hypothetical protein